MKAVPGNPRVFFALALMLATLVTGAAGAAVPRIQDLKLDPEKLAGIIRSRQLVLLYKEQPLQIKTEDGIETLEERFVSSMAVIDAPLAQVRALLLDLESYSKFIPQTEKVEIRSRGDDRIVADFELEFELPVVNVDIEYSLAYTLEPSGDITFKLVEGEMRESLGRWELIPLSGDRTLAAYTYWSDLEGMGFMVRTALKVQPDLKMAIPVASAAVVLDAVRRKAEGRPPKDKPPTSADKHPRIPELAGGQIPLNTIQTLARKGTILFIHPPQWIKGAKEPLELIFVSAGGIVRAPLQRTIELSCSFSRYKEFFDQVVRVKTKEIPKGYIVFWKLELGFGVFAVPIHYVLKYHESTPTRLVFRRLKGDLQYIYGAWEWIPLNDEETLILYTNASELGEKAPAVLKLGNLVPNRQVTVGTSSAAVIVENQIPWIEKQ